MSERAVRDSWRTPQWLCDLLPLVDLDPCSCAGSYVRTRNKYDLTLKQNGLELPWSGSVFVNPPYSNVLPWAEKAIVEESGLDAIGFLVNVDPSTLWWRRLQTILPYAFFFNKRVQFVPPTGVVASTNSKPQALLMDLTFWRMCHGEIVRLGELWEIQKFTA